ncbi:MAG TPA: hypothetical protein VIE65_09295 [Methylobacter sp.]
MRQPLHDVMEISQVHGTLLPASEGTNGTMAVEGIDPKRVAGTYAGNHRSR